ncbi:MAG: thioredoxin domain-containing protein [Candidatus Dormibacteraeota bacterium]|nr:thioredoxin domain-containing protein [Candidatus Dormibacteraeota bacterium]
MTNRLAAETSPYLRQHADNPVDWYPWGEEAFAVARREQRPVLLSVGYSACHWCHVMAHESFEDETTAALMNRLFVNVKVDREERPDVDSVYMQAVQGMTGHGGWPMTVFLTPDGTPYFGGTYFPPEERHGMPGFPRVLAAAADAFRNRREDIEASAHRMRDALAPRSPATAGDVSVETVDSAVRGLVAQTDMRHGGFGGAPKFPHPVALDLMLHRYAAHREPRVLEAALVTLDAMARGGMNDQVGGGFHRYSVDATWSVPHFEKMLYDNAQLATVYLHAFQLTGRGDLRDTCEQTLDYMARELLLPSGGFAASQDADSPGGEGAHFVWTPQQLREVLGDDDAALASRVFGVTDDGNFEGGATVLSLVQPPDDQVRQWLAPLRARMLESRAQRPAPSRDDKVITAWNALAVTAFAEAGAVLGRDDYALIARQSMQFLMDALLVDDVVMRSWREGQARTIGFLEDTALLASALLTVYEANGEPRFFDMAHELCEQIPRRYRDAGEYFDTASDAAETLIVRPRTIDDNPLPAGQSIAAHAFARLYGFTGEQRWLDLAMEIVRPYGPLMRRAPLGLASLADAAVRCVGDTRQIAVAGDPAAQATAELVEAVWQQLLPSRVLAWGPAGSVPLLDGKDMVGGAPAAYVCEHFSCRAPVTERDALVAELAAVSAG